MKGKERPSRMAIVLAVRIYRPNDCEKERKRMKAKGRQGLMADAARQRSPSCPRLADACLNALGRPQLRPNKGRGLCWDVGGDGRRRRGRFRASILKQKSKYFTTRNKYSTTQSNILQRKANI